jgi:chaperonin cofactor prefoldin
MGATRGKSLTNKASGGSLPAPSAPTERSPQDLRQQNQYEHRKTRLENRLNTIDKREEALNKRVAETQAIIGGYQKARGFSETENATAGSAPARPAGLRETAYAQQATMMQNSLGQLQKREGKVKSRLDETNEFLKKYQTPGTPSGAGPTT